ncbi:uncharacterized protein BDR25DRAFT_25111 [Lindgomyces ingoldianus]|uniref:Uncharacterized protein n=1 Tax=Lindgomyces ingoldianus TaxID=673940 RepID=A0ACB6QWL0_9PLEO|nr:uncharacterized protein BDR25DRAFT_25111 [Lindgomyces ingoldianus]KAF2471266.1 hypothetical protein BDR25DRAFT_25111 [Lindgomyces ingoldianus]
MATEAPDPRTFKSWEDAFQHPIPVVRKLENRLRSNAGENREKLRSLVGASYRSLLDTAETIIDMELRMGQVETKLARVGQNCNSRVVDRISRNAAKFNGQIRNRDSERYTFASQLSVLHNCPVVMSRLMRGDASYLLIAKILVISRLLHKALSYSETDFPFLNQIRDRLSALRRKLLLRIDKHLASTMSDTVVLVDTLCAYSLATSSTPTDVLRHFHGVRLEGVVKSLQSNADLAKNGIRALKLCLQTCQDTFSIFPRRLAESLAKLKVQPLAQDPEVRALHELNIDVHDRWIGEEARNYTPWPRHDELQRSEVEKLLSQWSRQAISAFLKGTKAALSQTKDLREVASLRQELIETWILSGSRMPGLEPAVVLDDLRDAMNEQLRTIVRSRAQALQTVVFELTSMLRAWSGAEDKRNTSLWAIPSAPIDLSDGAQSFKLAVLDTHQRHDEAVIRVVATYDNWVKSVLEVKAIVKSMRETRWDDTFADDVNDLDDDFGLDSKQSFLSDDDPRLLEEVTQVALADSLASLRESFIQIILQLTSSAETSPLPQHIFLLRVIREIAGRIPRLRLHDRSASLSSPFTAELLKPLHASLAKKTTVPALAAYNNVLTAGRKYRSKSHILWEGNPPLPAQPSPSAFRFLQELVKSMGACGPDLWAPDSVHVLKAMALDEVSKTWKETLNVINTEEHLTASSHSPVDEPEPQGAEKSNASDLLPVDKELKSERLKQLLLDMLYIYRYLGSLDEWKPFEELVRAVEEASGVDEGMMSRMRKNASDYGRKTYLLFALLS